MYFSSSGGRTLSALDVFGTDMPYLRSVADPWDDASPNHAWAPKVMGAKQLGRDLKLRSAVDDVTVVPGAAGAAGLAGTPERLHFMLANGKTVDLDLQEIRERMDLLSTGFSLGELQLAGPAQPVGAGGEAQLTGVARSVAGATLEASDADGSWHRVAAVRAGADGAFTLAVHPKATTTYRISAGDVVGPSVVVRVEPTVKKG